MKQKQLKGHFKKKKESSLKCKKNIYNVINCLILLLLKKGWCGDIYCYLPGTSTYLYWWRGVLSVTCMLAGVTGVTVVWVCQMLSFLQFHWNIWALQAGHCGYRTTFNPSVTVFFSVMIDWCWKGLSHDL